MNRPPHGGVRGGTTQRGPDRSALLWESLREVLDDPGGDGVGKDGAERLRVLDVGGGTGGFALRVAERGHAVTVVDPSPDAIAALERRAREGGLEDRLTGVLGDASTLDGAAGGDVGPVDVVLLHGVLEVVDDPVAAVRSALGALRPGGRLSVVVAGRWAAVTARALAGDLVRARELAERTVEGWDVRADGPRRYARDELTDLVAGAGARVDRVEAVRVYSDLVPAEVVDGVPGARAALLDLERAVARLEALGAVGSQLHLLATRA